MPPIITVENLGKRYTLRHEPGAGGYRRLSEDLMAAVKKPFKRPFGSRERGAASRRGAGSSEHGVRSEEQRAGSEAQCSLAAPGSPLAASSLAAPGSPLAASSPASSPASARRSPLAAEEFWALRDVSFEVQQGEVLGIIGRNGAGKSTLLKILSRITEPTEGRVSIRGRVASLLEVGTGFHPELTGRENVFLNGAILGMTRAEIRRKFDEIIAFAEVEKFLDTPVKRYSSGMYVRLAFAVAAHLEPEILVVDEVLAVGDAEFQKKCLGKMGEVARGGRTVLFVSHNLAAVRTLCRRAVVLNAGSIAFSGTVGAAIESYMGRRETELDVEFVPDPARPSITRIAVDPAAAAKGTLSVRLSFESPIPLLRPVPGLVISSRSGTPVFGSNTRFHRDEESRARVRRGVAHLFVKNLPILPGSYTVSAWLGDWQSDYDYKPDAVSFDFGGDRPPHTPNADVIGYVDADAHWSVAAESHPEATQGATVV